MSRNVLRTLKELVQLLSKVAADGIMERHGEGIAKERMIFRMMTDGRRAATVMVRLKGTPTMDTVIAVCLN